MYQTFTTCALAARVIETGRARRSLLCFKLFSGGGAPSCLGCSPTCCAVLQSIMEACVADIQAVFERDPACDRYTHCILYFKGFQAIQCHRIAHWLWMRNRRVRGRLEGRCVNGLKHSKVLV